MPLLSGSKKAHLESSDWCRAHTLSERIAWLGPKPQGESGFDDKAVRLRLQSWHSEYPHISETYLSAYLDAIGISSQTFLDVVGEPIDALHGRCVTSPAWLDAVHAAFSDAAPAKPISFRDLVPGNSTVLFLNLVEPLIRKARQRLHDGLTSVDPGTACVPILAPGIEHALLMNVSRQLLQMLVPTLLLELNVARLQGALEGETQEQRFDCFVMRLLRPDVALAILREYSTLARQVVGCLDNWVTYSLEFVRNLVDDWSELRASFFAGKDPGPLVSLDDSKGDQHRNGRSVLILTFSSGFRLVYKPRPLAVAAYFQDLLTWLNERGAEPALLPIKILDRGTYGWAEFVSPQGCTSSDEVRRFYTRQGEYLALLYALEATDFHYENLIAAGEHPILVDLETLFQPDIGSHDRTITRAYRDSVLRIGLLPQRMFANMESDGIDLSGLTAAAGQPLPYPVLHFASPGTDQMRLVQKVGESTASSNQPALNGESLDILDYVDAIIGGFTSLYRLLQLHREVLLSAEGPLACFAGATVRVILRPTLTYGLLLRSSFHPDALRDAVDREILFSALGAGPPASRLLNRILPFEIEDLHKHDIPIFTARIERRDLLTSSGQEIAEFFPESGLARVHRRVQNLGENDYLRQLWFIRASLATMEMGREPRSRSVRQQRARPVVSRGSLLEAADAVGERLDALALQSGEEISWIGLALTAKDHWSLVPLGLDLYNGLPGVALFLGYLGTILEKPRYTTLARMAIATVRRHLSTTPLNSFSIGAFEGLGGIAFLFSHLAVLWNDQELLDEAKVVAERARDLIAYDRKLDITGGAAGCIMSLLSLHAIAPYDSIRAAAVECGDHLIRHARRVGGSLAWPSYFPAEGPLTGLAHGASGIGWALLELHALTGAGRFKAAGLKAFSYESSLFSPVKQNWPDLRKRTSGGDWTFMIGWCHGAPGIALTRLRALRYVDSPTLRKDIDAGLETTMKHGFRKDHCLCHGALGNLEPLLQARDLVDRSLWTERANLATDAILQSIYEDGWSCGVPLGVESPGLMTGLAGIGYGLLRLAESSKVPAILVLEPPPRL